MHNALLHFGRGLGRATLLCAGLTLSLSTVAQGDPLLDMLNAEADEVTKTKGSTQNNGPEDTRTTFEAELRKNNKGDHYLYMKLPEDSKQVVYNKYRETGKVDTVRSLIVKLYTER